MAEPRDALGVEPGSNVTFSVDATGLRLRFLWQRVDETLLTDHTKYVGVATNMLTILSIRPEDAGLYVCVVSNAAGSVRSQGAILMLSKFMASPLGLASVTWVGLARNSWQNLIENMFTIGTIRPSLEKLECVSVGMCLINGRGL